jgi:hypothetical protein
VTTQGEFPGDDESDTRKRVQLLKEKIEAST